VKLSAAQRRALEASRDGKLRCARSTYGGEDWWITGTGLGTTVRGATADVLLRQGLIRRPPLRSAAVVAELTDAGREALE
jgi:hypothetical protein